MDVVIPCGSYDIVLGHGIMANGVVVTDILARLAHISTFVIVTDTNVGEIYGQVLQQQFEKHFVASPLPTDATNSGTATKRDATNTTISTKRVLLHAIPAGETSKCRAMKDFVEDHVLFANRCHRDTCIIALGGGVVGDLSGYLAATYMRGIPFVQLPTSLLACVDSSIGGKTGIDIEAFGKNLIGSFHMPQRVYIDLQLLRTLPKREFINGMAEVIKAGAIFDTQLFEILENTSDRLLKCCAQEDSTTTTTADQAQGQVQDADLAILQRVVAMAVQVKAQVVTQDVQEHGLRAILNFGHSIGHGIEALLQPAFLHGECVAIGMMKEAEIARAMQLCSSATVGRLRRCLEQFGLPVTMPHGMQAAVDTHEVLIKMEVDKKNSQGVKKIILLQEIGRVASNPFTRVVSDQQIALAIEKRVTLTPGVVANGRIVVPGSKSISNRVLLMAALGTGRCCVRGLLFSEDTQVMMTALEKLGATFTWEQEANVLVVQGTGGRFATLKPHEEFYMSNAGTATRFLATTLTLAIEQNAKNWNGVVLTGNERMQERPIGPLVTALQRNGCVIEYRGKPNCVPLAIRPGGGGLQGGEMHLEAKVSSQYVSSILLNAPYAKQPLDLQLDEQQPTSLPYILMTIQLMKQFGIPVETIAPNRFRVPCGVYSNPSEFVIEVDASSATYPLALAAITGGTVTVDHLGATSLQGDAAFHTILRQMGCETRQDATSTTVVGPSAGHLLQAVEIDMEPMTDAFMTAAVLGAFAKGRTKITGIANQRVKECNRIEVMVQNLSRLGVQCGELDDGMWIEGVAGDASKLHGACIECHNDHRIAMSFAVLASVVKDVVILDKDCTEKTYPEFWDHLQQHLGLEVQPVTCLKQSFREELSVTSKPEPVKELAPALILIGMRGAGKTTLGLAAAKKLGLQFVDMDDELEKEFGRSIADFVAENGWQGFRNHQEALLARLLAHPPPNTIIATGGGIVETPANVALLAKYKHVVQINRAIEDVLAYLDNGDEKNSQRPSLGESHEQVWKRRASLYKKASTFEFTINAGDSDWTRIMEDFCRFVGIVLPNVASAYRFDLSRLALKDTFFLSLTFGNLITTKRSLLTSITQDVDALELRVDLLDSQEPAFIAQQVAFLRGFSKLPIIYTVRTKNQGGEYPDDEAKVFELLRLGIRLGCQVIDMECCWSLKERKNLVHAKQHTNMAVIGSFHAIQKPLSDAEIAQVFVNCYQQAQVDVIKVVVKAFDVQDSLRVQQFGVSLASKWQIPYIAICTTSFGQLSRILNRVLTPVTHPSLPVAAAPGQMSAAHIMKLRYELGILPARRFHLFGSPIQHSPSPAMHNAAFAHCHLPNKYSLVDTLDPQEVIQKMRSNERMEFGGGSVTIPHKVDIVDQMDRVSDAVQRIGALNTIIRRETWQGQVVLLGDNTDWKGILRPIQKCLKQLHPELHDITDPTKTRNWKALVIGAGGTAMAASFAMQQLGVQLFVHNRTFAKAQALAEQFGKGTVALQQLAPEDIEAVDIVVGTIPASSGFVLPDYLVHERVIVLDAAYKPRVTPLLQHAASRGAVCIEGIEMLYEQAVEQFRLWHPTSQVPVQVFREACYQAAAEPMESK